MKNDLVLLLAFPVLAILFILLPMISIGAESEEDLAKKTQNPIADLISLPLQFNQDYDIGPADAERSWLNVQPVIPVTLNPEWNVIVRTIIPFIDAESPLSGGEDESGLGDITQSFFFSPKKPVRGWIVGAGPVLLYPSASDNELGNEKWGAGPTFVVLKQESGLTYGLLSNHIWSFAGNDDRTNVSSTFLQPILSYTTRTYTSFGLNTESTYDWKEDQWTVPINATISQLLKMGGRPMSFQLGYRYYAEAPEGGPDLGLRFTVTFLFPKG